MQQTVLEMDGRSVRNELVEHLASAHGFGILMVSFFNHTDGCAITLLRFVKATLVPIEAAQAQQEHTLFNAVASSFLATGFVGCDGRNGVILQQVYISHGIIHLIEIFFVVFRACHPAQRAYGFLCRLRIGKHLGLEDAGIKGELIWRTLLQTFLQSLVRFLLVAQDLLHLAQEKIKTGFLQFARLFASGQSEVGECFGQSLLSQKHVGHGGGVLAFQPMGNTVVGNAFQSVLSIVEPIQLGIAACQPQVRLGYHLRFGFVDA